jgi:hypothetical protein
MRDGDCSTVKNVASDHPSQFLSFFLHYRDATFSLLYPLFKKKFSSLVDNMAKVMVKTNVCSSIVTY